MNFYSSENYGTVVLPAGKKLYAGASRDLGADLHESVNSDYPPIPP